jgi:hypothetical protein
VTGFIVYLQKVSFCWRSKAQSGVTLSSSKAEYVVMSEAVKEIRFIYFLLCGIGIEVEFPIVVKTENVGALLMSQNCVCTKQHVYIYERHAKKFFGSIEDFRSECTFWSRKGIENIPFVHSRLVII